MNKERLQEIFDFSDDEIYANREGYLTNKQEDFLENYRKSIRRGWIFSFVIIFLCIIFWVGMGIVIYKQSPEGAIQALPYWGITLGVFIFIYLFFSIIGVFKSRDVRKGRIRTAEGIAEKHSKMIRTKRGTSLGMSYIIKIEKTKFIIAYPKQFEAIDDGKNYRIYYIRTSHVHIILSIEELSAAIAAQVRMNNEK